MKNKRKFLQQLTVKELQVLLGLNKLNSEIDKKSYGGTVSILSRKKFAGEPLLIQVCREGERKIWKLNEKILPEQNFKFEIEKILHDYQKVIES